MYSSQFWLLRQNIQIMLPFLEYRFNVGQFHRMIFGDSFIASAIGTEIFAVRKMDVKTDALVLSKLAIRLVHQIDPATLREVSLPMRDRWIAGISWSRYIVFLKQG